MKPPTTYDATTFSLKRNFADIITMLRSEIARLIFGYLKDNCSIEIAEMFLNTCPYLEECRKMKKNGRMFNCKIQGNTLEQILDKFDALNWFIPQLTTEENCSHKNSLALLRNIVDCKLNLLNNAKSDVVKIDVPIREPVFSNVVTRVENEKNSPDRIRTIADCDTISKQSENIDAIVTDIGDSVNSEAVVDYSAGGVQPIARSSPEKMPPQSVRMVNDISTDDATNLTTSDIFSNIEKNNEDLQNTSSTQPTDQNVECITERTNPNGYLKSDDISILSTDSISNEVAMCDESLQHEPYNVQITPSKMNHSMESVSSKENENVFENVGKTFGRPFLKSPKKAVENIQALGYDHTNRNSHIYTTPAKQQPPRDGNKNLFETPPTQTAPPESEDTNNTSEDTVTLSADRIQNSTSPKVALKKENIPWDLKVRTFIGDGEQLTAHIRKRKHCSDSSKSKKKKESMKKRKLNDNHVQPIKNDTKRMPVDRIVETDKNVSKNKAKLSDNSAKSTPIKNNQIKGSTSSRTVVDSNSKTEPKRSMVKKDKQPVAKECKNMITLEATNKSNNIDSTVENVVKNNEQNANNGRKSYRKNTDSKNDENDSQQASLKSHRSVQSQNDSFVKVTSPLKSNTVSIGEKQKFTVDLEVTSSDQMSNDAPLELQVSPEFLLFSVLPKSNKTS